MSEQAQQIPIAIVGMGALLPGSAGVDGFWRALLEGRNLITDVPPDRWLVADHYDPDPSAVDRTYCRRGAFLPEVDFDPAAYGIPPRSLSATDTSQLLALLVADWTLADAGGLAGLDTERVSVVLGASQLELAGEMAHRLERPVWRNALRELGLPESQVQAACERIAEHYPPWQEDTFPGLLGNVVAGRIANRFDLHGTNCTVDAACASSFAALSMGLDELALGRADLVLAGGVDTLSNAFMYQCFSKTPALSASGDCRPFAAAADGTMLGEGLVMFALKRLVDAEADHDRIYAVIRGLGSSSDGRAGAIYAPDSTGQERALRRAYSAAGYGPDTVGLVEAHGTGTKAGDAAEFAALHTVFTASGRSDRPWCALGSVKSQVGHTKCAAGAVGLLKAVLALHHKVLPPTIKVDRPDPALGLADSPLYLNTAALPWVAEPGHARRASVSSFGFGGTNFHVTVEEYPVAEQAWRCRAVPTELVLAAGDNVAQLLSLRDQDLSLADLARKSQTEFDPTAPCRLALVAADLPELHAKLAWAANHIQRQHGQPLRTPDGVYYGAEPAEQGGIAFLFPGQGSQYTAMSADLAMHLPRAQTVWDAAAGVLPGLPGVVFPPPAFTESARQAQEEGITATEWAQPALAVHSVVLLELARSLGMRPDVVAGHSFGELVALHAAGVFDLTALRRLARQRGELMRDAARQPGAMLAALASVKEVTAALVRGRVPEVWVANHNGPAEVVLSGTWEAINACERALPEHGITVRRLNAAAAFHSPLVAPATRPLREFLATLDMRAPMLPVYGNVDAAPYPAEPDQIRDLLVEQIASPVRFADAIEAMYAAGARTFVEVGAGAVLSGMVGRILSGRAHLAVPMDRRGTHGMTSLHQALGQLAVRGVSLDFAALWEHHAPPAARATPAKATTVIKISGGNHGRRYPPRGGAAALPPPNPEPPTREAVANGQSLGLAPVNMLARPAVDTGQPHMVDEALRKTAEAHEVYQRVMADSHLAYLKLAESWLTSSVATQRDAPPEGGSIPLPMAAHAPAEPTSPDIQAMDVMTATDPVAGHRTIAQEADEAPTQSVAETDIPHLIRSIVADRTGYPVDVIGEDMDLETDLGIDSIKRVEILSGMRERLPGLAGAVAVESEQATELLKVRTIGELARRIRQGELSMGDVDADAQLPPAGSTPALTRRAIRAVPAAADGQRMVGLGEGFVAVTDDAAGIAALVVGKLQAQGVTASVVTEVPSEARGVVLLDGLRQAKSVDVAVAAQRAAFVAARTVGQAFGANGGIFVTVQDTGGDFGLRGGDPDRAWLGGMAALARTAAREWPQATVKAIDCERGDRTADQVAGAIVAELLTGGADLNVGLGADGARTRLLEVDAPARPGGEPEFGPEDVLVVSGGARGVTAAAVHALAAHCRLRVALLGRTQLAVEPQEVAAAADEAALLRLFTQPGTAPAAARAHARQVLAGREIRRTIAGLEGAGATVRYLAVDVTDRAAVASALAGIRRDWGPITGIVHGAGVVADKWIAEKADEDFDRVFGTKVTGLRALLEATVADPLRLLCAFSSVVAWTGNAGQCDYAMANETLTHVLAAEAVRRPGCLTRSLLWGPWRGGMVTDSLAGHFQAAGVELIPQAAGTSTFVTELGISAGPVPVLLTAGAFAPEPQMAGPGLRQVVRVSERTHGYLADHAVAGVPVVPVATVLDWFARAAGAWSPGRVALHDLQVLRRIDLPFLGNGGHHCEIRGNRPDPANGCLLGLELIDDHAATCYRATVTGSDERSSGWNPPRDLQPLARQEIYEGHVLFHGPRFRALHGVDGVSTAGAAGDVIGVADLGWPAGDWTLDPAAVDGGLQLALLWAHHVLGSAALPMAVAECRPHRQGPLRGPARCVVRGGPVGADHAGCDLALLGPNGSPDVELLGVRLVRRPH